MTPEEILARFQNVEPRGPQQWTAKCPSHDDATNSLSVGVGDDGRVLLHCHAGCPTADVVRAIGCRMVDLFPGGEFTPTESKKSKAAIINAYDYVDETGALLYQVVRRAPKGFRQRMPVDGGDWSWSTKGVRRVLYRLPELLSADPAALVYLTEGEKDADALAALGLLASTNVGGAGKWRPEYNKHLRDRDVVILPDNDQPGRKHAQAVADALFGTASSVKVLELPELPEYGDISDWLTAGGTLEQLTELMCAAPEYLPSPTRAAPKRTDASPRQSQATKLLTTVDKELELFHDADGHAFATIRVQDHAETCKVRSKQFRRHLARRFYQSHQSVPGSQALHDAIEVLDGRAVFEGPEVPVHVRVAEFNGKIYLDLADREWNAVEIDDQGWRIVSPPVKFRRPKAMLGLPAPEPGGCLTDLRQFINIRDSEWPLVAGALVAMVRPCGPYPVLCLHGEQGSAKSSAARVLRRLVDPNSADLRAEPKEPRDLVIAANNGWILTCDNISYLPAWLSDALCRLSTGGGFATRALFSDDDESIFTAQRPIVLNGIEEVATRGDLLDRALMISLPVIPETQRRDEREFWAAFERERPKLLGALLSAASTATARLPTTKLATLPRMADFALWSTAAEPALGLSRPFLDAYAGNRQDANVAALESSPVVRAVLALVESKQEWMGTASALLDELEQIAELGDRKTKPKGWPGNPRALSGALKRLAPNLRIAGIEVEFGQRSKSARSIRLRKGDANRGDCVTQDVACVTAEEFASPPNAEKSAAADANDANDAKMPFPSAGEPASLDGCRVQLRI